MAAMTFVAMFLSRTATPGPVFFVAGFIVAYGLTLGDQVLGLALQPATAGNAEQFALPEIVFGPPEEALVRFLLWLSLAVALPVILLIVANLLTGRDPARLLYQALAERLATAARFCAGESGAERRLEAQAFEGTAQLHKLHHLAGLLHRGRPRLVWGASLIDEIGRLGLLLLAWFRVAGDARNPLVPAAGACRRGGTRAAGPSGPEPRTGHHHRDRRRATGGRRDLAHAASDRGDIGGNGGRAGSAWRGEGAASAAGGGCVHQPGIRPLRAQGHAGGDDLLFRHEPGRLAGHPHLRHHLLLRRARHRRRDDPQGDAALHRLPDRRRARPRRDPAADAADDRSWRPAPAAGAGDLARRLGRQRQRAHRLCRPADQPRLLSCRAAGLWPDDRHVYGEGPHHRHPVRQYRDLRDLHDDLAGERGQRCAHEPRQSIRATGGVGGIGCPPRWRGFAGRSVRGRDGVRAGDRAGARGPGQGSVRNERGAARRREAADRRDCGRGGR